nr:hypothetical protein [Tanacetum cinerariifolium]
MSSPNHPTFGIEDAFSFNFLDYFLATQGNTSPDSSNDLTKYLLATLVFSPLHDDPYIEEISPPKDAKTPVKSSISASASLLVGSSSPNASQKEINICSTSHDSGCIQQLIADGIAAAWEAQAATMANTKNPNRNTRPRETLVAKGGNYKDHVVLSLPSLKYLKDVQKQNGKLINLDEAVAHGAGIFAENLSCIDNKAMQSLVLVDVTLLSLGIAQVGDIMRMDNNVPLRLRENGLSVRGLNDLKHEINKVLKSLDENPDAKIDELKNNREELENSCKRIKHQPLETASEEHKATWKAEYKKHNDVAYLMLGKMSPALQKQNFNMHCLGKTMTELHALLIDYEKGLKDKAPTPQGFKEERKLSYGEQYMQVCNGAQATVEAIGVFDLVLPSGLVLKLNNCYYAPSMVRGVVSLSCLLDLRFNHTIASNGISISLNGLFYFSVVSVNGEFEIDMNNNVSKNNNNSIFSINKKRKLDLDSSYLWHCRLAHIGKTRMQKLQHEEVELQLGKKIKALHSNRGSKYLSQEFKDYLRYPKETMGYCFYFPPENKVIVARYGNFLERDLISQKFSGRDNDLEDNHMDTLPSENTSEIPVETESLGSPSELILVRRSERTTRAMDEEMNYMKVMKVWIVVDLPPNAKVVRNVKTAFLNGRLDEDIYLEQPEGYVDPKYPNHVCKLQRSIYGLKRASSQWNKRFDEEIKKFILIQNRDEPRVYRKASGSDIVFLILYVDDILIMGNNIPRLKEVKDYLRKCFSIKDLGEAAYILGIKIYRDRSRQLIGLSQSAYIDKILKKYNMHNSKKGYLRMEVKHELSNEFYASTPEEVAYMKKVPYASAVGSIIGKPDTELDVTSFCDASWQCDKDDTKSQTGYVFVFNGGAVDWKSKMHTTIAMHSAQAEYVAASEAAMEAVWIRKFVRDLEHFLWRYHYVREQVETGEIKLIKVHTDDNLDDPFTKALPRGMVIDHAKGIGLQLASSFMHTYD